MRKLFFILMTLIGCCLSLQAQSRTYSGSVVDATNNEPLIGATIMPIGGGQGAAADIDGNFSITVPASVKKATVSYVGYTSQTVDLRNGMVVKLQSSATNLDDVIVVAYGTSTKEALTGSVAVVGSKEIEERPVTSVTAALEGNAPGVQVNNSTGTPGSAPTIRIRGFNSFTNNNPLYVVDGVPFEGSIADLNPADIESMSVLKDAASCALYGNRGANGVILITTKRAKKSDKVDVTLTMRQGMYTRGLPMYDRLNANEWTQATFNGLVNGIMSSSGFSYEDALEYYRENYISSYAKLNLYGGVIRDNDGNVIDHVGYGVGTDFGNDQLFDENGRLVPGSYLPGYAGDLDWWDAVSRTGYRQEYSVNAAAAGDRYNVFASAGYLKENGYMYQTDFERFTGRIRAEFNPTSYLRFGLNLAGTAQESQTGQTGSDLGLSSNPFLVQGYAPIYPYYAHDALGNMVYDEDGKPIWNTATYLNSDNVAWAQRLDKNNYSATVINADIFGTAILPYGFNLTIKGSMRRDKTHSMSYMNNIVGSGAPSGASSGNGGRLDEGFGNYKSHTFMQTLDWSHDYGLHHIEALLDHENWQYSEDSSSVGVYNQIFENIYALSNFEDSTTPSQGIAMVRTESYLGRVRYNWDGRYFGEASIRRDGTSRFAKKNHWGNFWSVGASWVINREKWMQQVDWINYLKLRAAYGSVGNDAAASAYSHFSLYGFAPYDGVKVLIPTSLASDNIKWEATKTFDLALEGSLFNDRFDFSIGYFNKRNSDLLMPVTQPASIGMTSVDGYNSSVLTNIGTVQNVGWELQFGYDIIRNAEFTWNVKLDATLYKNKILKLPFGRDIVGQGYFQGYSLYEHFTYDWAGVDKLTGRSVYRMNPESPDFWKYETDTSTTPIFNEDAYMANYNKAKEDGSLLILDGEAYTYDPSLAGRKRFGTSLPTVYGSFSTAASWKGISLSLLFTYGLGGKTNDSVYRGLLSMSTSAAALHKDVLKGWTAPVEGVDENSISRLDPNGVPQINTETSRNNFYESSMTLTSSSYLTLKNINLSYDLPRKWVNALQMQGINIGCSIDNVFIASKRKGMNPTYGYGGGQGYNYVPARVFSFQLGARF